MQEALNHKPKARVNISVDIETSQGKRKQELPLKLLVIGDFSHKQESTPLKQRQRIPINQQNFNQVLQRIAPKLQINVPNRLQTGENLNVDLDFKSLNDFMPENIVANIPNLRLLLAMRNLLKDFKSNLLDNQQLRKALEELMQSETDLQALSQQLGSLAK